MHTEMRQGLDQRNNKDKHYVWFDGFSYHGCRETVFNARVDVKLGQSHWSVKCRSRAQGHRACLKGKL